MASASYWQELIELWECSGLKQSEFCRQPNLGKSTFSKRISIHCKTAPKIGHLRFFLGDQSLILAMALMSSGLTT